MEEDDEKRLVSLLLILCLAVPILASCHATGRAAGEAVEETKEAGDDLKRGYEQGKMPD